MTQAQNYIADAMKLFNLDKWVDGTLNGGFGSDMRDVMKSAKVLAKYKHGGVLMSRNGGVRFVYQFEDLSRVCIGPYQRWLRIRELTNGVTSQEAWDMAKYAAELEAKFAVEDDKKLAGAGE